MSSFEAQLPESVQRVARALQDKGHPHSPVTLDDAARTAQQAADALGIAVGQIAKSIIFRRKSDDAAVLVITSGDRRGGSRAAKSRPCRRLASRCVAWTWTPGCARGACARSTRSRPGAA